MRGRADYEGVDVPKVTAAAAALLLVLALAGCGDDEQAEGANTERTATTQQNSSESPKPLAAEPETPSTQDEAEAAFIEYVRANLRPDNVVPNATDAQLIAAGLDGCAQLDADVNPDDVTVIAGEERDGGGYFRDSSLIVSAARMFICKVSP